MEEKGTEFCAWPIACAKCASLLPSDDPCEECLEIDNDAILTLAHALLKRLSPRLELMDQWKRQLEISRSVSDEEAAKAMMLPIEVFPNASTEAQALYLAALFPEGLLFEGGVLVGNPVAWFELDTGGSMLN